MASIPEHLPMLSALEYISGAIGVDGKSGRGKAAIEQIAIYLDSFGGEIDPNTGEKLVDRHPSNQFPRPFQVIGESEYWRRTGIWQQLATETRLVLPDADPQFFAMLAEVYDMPIRSFVECRIRWDHEAGYAVALPFEKHPLYLRVGCDHVYRYQSVSMSVRLHKCFKCGVEYTVDHG